MQTQYARKLTNNHDSTVQAMTEVALGLSMAFFAILILALISMGVPQEKHQPKNLSKIDDTEKLLIVNANESNADKSNEDEHSKSTDMVAYIFYYQSHFYDQDLKPIEANELLPEQQYVLALPANTSLSETIQVKEHLKKYNVLVTQMNDEWSQALAMRTQ